MSSRKPRGKAGPVILLTCEHAGNVVPPAYQPLFRGRRDVLKTHRGVDIGILPVAQSMANGLSAPLLIATVTRLLVDLNRDEANPKAFSEFTRRLPAETRQKILRRYHRPFRKRFYTMVSDQIAKDRTVLHLSIHSFTPEFNGKVRGFPFGLLFDHRRPRERTVCEQWRHSLRERRPNDRALLNRPYTGATDGHTTALRKLFPRAKYLGIEVEVNQAMLSRKKAAKKIGEDLARALMVAIET